MGPDVADTSGLIKRGGEGRRERPGSVRRPRCSAELTLAAESSAGFVAPSSVRSGAVGTDTGSSGERAFPGWPRDAVFTCGFGRLAPERQRKEEGVAGSFVVHPLDLRHLLDQRRNTHATSSWSEGTDEVEEPSPEKSLIFHLQALREKKGFWV